MGNACYIRVTRCGPDPCSLNSVISGVTHQGGFVRVVGDRSTETGPR